MAGHRSAIFFINICLIFPFLHYFFIMEHNRTKSALTSGRKLFLAMMLNFTITAIEAVGGVLSGSLSLISDALHNFSDGIALIISYYAIHIAGRQKTPQYTFGKKRAEIIAAVINAATLIAICFYLFNESYHRLFHPEPITSGLMIGVAAVGLVANIGGTVLLHEDSKKSINIRAAYLHLFSDAVSSVAVILGGIVIYFSGVYWLDPLLTIFISLYVLKKSFEIIKEATNVFMMRTPKFISLENIRNEIEEIPGVLNIHHVHVWKLDENSIHFEAHIDVDDILVSESCVIGESIKDKLSRYGISHVTLQFECDVCTQKSLIDTT